MPKLSSSRAIEAPDRPSDLEQEVERLQRELERAQSRFNSFVNHVPSYIHIIDRDLKVTFINRGSNQASAASIVGTTIGDFMPPADRRRVRRKLRQVIATGEPTEYDFAGPTANGTAGWYRQSAGPIRENGRVTGLVLSTIDITRDRYYTEALRQGRLEAEAARAYDRALLNSIGEGLIVVNEHGEIANINPPALTMLGYEADELIGKWFPKMIVALNDEGEIIDPIDRPVLRSLSSGRAISEVVHYCRKDGTTFPVAATVSPVVIDKQPVGAIEVFRDLTRERQLDKAKEEFVSLASHQLRTPATGVKAYISMLLDGYGGELSERQAEFMHKIYESNERQLQIVNDMLNVARADAGRIVPEMASTDLRNLVQDVADELRMTARERKQDLEVTLPVKSLNALLDPQLIRMAVENIAGNASKYTHEGGIISIKLQVSKEQASIEIQDTGVGISPHNIPKLFQRFSRIDNALSTQRGGSGLGLYLAQTIIQLHKGRIDVDSRLGKGTTFTISLPLEIGATM